MSKLTEFVLNSYEKTNTNPGYDKNAVAAWLDTWLPADDCDVMPETVEVTVGSESIKVSKDNLFDILSMLSNHQYDGRMRSILYKKPTSTDYLKQAGEVIANHFRMPSVGCFQIINILEAWAALTGIWLWYPTFVPGMATYFSLTALSVLVAINNYYYTVGVPGLDPKDYATKLKDIEGEYTALQGDLKKNLGDNEKASEALMDSLLQPGFASRLFMEARTWASLLTKLLAAFAVISAEFKEKLPFMLIVLAASVAGMIEGTDLAYTKVAIVGGENRRHIEYQRGTIPVRRVTDMLLMFHRVADFPLVPWLMAKLGPFAWFAVKWPATEKLA